MRPIYDTTVTREDGSPLRKYEMPEVKSSRAASRFALTFILVNMFLVLKNVLFPDDARKFGAAPMGPGNPDHGHGGEVKHERSGPGDEAPEEQIAELSEVDELEEIPSYLARPKGSSTSLELIEEERPPIRIPGFAYSSGTPLIASNDNPAVIFSGSADLNFTFRGSKGNSGASGRGTSGDDRTDDEDDDKDPVPPTRTNRRPVVAASIVFDSILASQAVAFTLQDFLRHASDPDGDALKIVGLVSSKGTTVEVKPGHYVFTPDPSSLGPVTFKYFVSDGQEQVLQTAKLTVVKPTGQILVGTSTSEVLIGTMRNDVIDAREGDDTVIGLAGNDVIYGGDGRDRIMGGDGDDVIYGGDGDDVIFAGLGNDVVSGGKGRDVIAGEEGDDTLFGDEDDDTISGGSDDDSIDGGMGDDDLAGDDGDDTLFGRDGNDEMSGGTGDDIMDGGAGDDDLEGDEGNDIMFGAAGTDKIRGGVGHDEMDGGEGDDLLEGGDGDDVMYGAEGNDEMVGGTGDDQITGGSGDDHVDGGEGQDIIFATSDDGEDDYDGGEGTDTYDISSTMADATIDLFEGLAESEQIKLDRLENIENAVGGGGDDVIIANDEVNLLKGGGGDDIFVFRTTASAGFGSGSRDRILDFEVGDKIDLDDISREFRDLADAFKDDGIKKFVLIGANDVFKRPGELRFKYDENDAVTVLEGNIDTDSDTEFEIEVSGNRDFQDHDFTWNT